MAACDICKLDKSVIWVCESEDCGHIICDDCKQSKKGRVAGSGDLCNDWMGPHCNLTAKLTRITDAPSNESGGAPEPHSDDDSFPDDFGEVCEWEYWVHDFKIEFDNWGSLKTRNALGDATANSLKKVINKYANRGWEFIRIETVAADSIAGASVGTKAFNAISKMVVNQNDKNQVYMPPQIPMIIFRRKRKAP
jgi:hypothetical protein